MKIEPLYIYNNKDILFVSSIDYSIQNIESNLYQISGIIIHQIIPPSMDLFPNPLHASCGSQIFSQFVFESIKGSFPEISFEAKAI